MDPASIYAGSRGAYDRILLAAPRVSPKVVKYMAESDVKNIGFLGTGKMATALARGWLSAHLITRERICGSDPLSAARTGFHKEIGAAVFDDNAAVVARSDILILAV